MPIVTTLHTILQSPNPAQKLVMDELIKLSERIIVMSAHGAALLQEVHGALPGKIDRIPHGKFRIFSPFRAKYSVCWTLKASASFLLSVCCLPIKVSSTSIDAMPSILDRFPDTLYLVLGATHPHIKAQQG